MLDEIRLDKLLQNAESPYEAVIMASKRARQLNAYHHRSEEDLEHYVPPMVEEAAHPLTTAMREICQHKITRKPS